MYTYPEALNAMEKIARDLLVKMYPDVIFHVRVAADSRTGTASVDWQGNPKVDAYVYATINMPVRPAVYRMSGDEFRHWAAYILHEVGHPAHTDMSVWKDAVASGRHRLLNALEDVREEKCTIDANVAANAVRVFSELDNMLQAKAVADGYDPNKVENIGWTIALLGREANGYTIDISSVVDKLDPKGIVARILGWALDDLKACQSTSDCYDLSKRIINAVNALRTPEPMDTAEEIQPEIEPQEAPSLSDDEHESEPMGEQRGGSDVPNEPIEPQGEAPVGSGHGGQDKPKDESEKEFTDEDIAEVDMKPTTRDNMVSSGNSRATQARLVRVLRDIEHEVEKGDTDRAITGRNWNGSVEMVTGNASKMGRQRALLARAMKANDLDSYEGGRARGRLDKRALSKAAMGESHIFGRRTITEGYDTDVQILVDGSGSMSGSHMMAASSLALVVAQAAAQVGVDCTAHVFNDTGLVMATKGKAKPKANKFAYMINNVMGGTPLTESLLKAARLQRDRAKGKRRIMFVVTDGGCNSGPDMVKAAATYIEASYGTEIANLNIGRPMGLFRNEVGVNVKDVAGTGLNQLTSVLERGVS